MRSLLLALAPVLLSFQLLACSNDEVEPTQPEPPHDVVKNELAAGSACASDSDCQSGLECVYSQKLSTQGFPAPPCQGDACNPAPAPAPAPTPAPTPAPAPEPRPAAPKNGGTIIGGSDAGDAPNVAAKGGICQAR